jgi:hypothetical protein
MDDGERVLRPLRASRSPLLDLVGPMPYVGFQSALESPVMHGWNYYWKSSHLPELRDDLIDVLAEHAFSCSSPRSYVAMFHLKGAVSRVAEGATAFGNRQASHAITLDCVWRPGEDFGDRDTAWTKRFFAALGRFREGVYVNFLGGAKIPAGSARRMAIPSTTGWRRSRPRTTPITSSTTTRTSGRPVSDRAGRGKKAEAVSQQETSVRIQWQLRQRALDHREICSEDPESTPIGLALELLQLVLDGGPGRGKAQAASR